MGVSLALLAQRNDRFGQYAAFFETTTSNAMLRSNRYTAELLPRPKRYRRVPM